MRKALLIVALVGLMSLPVFAQRGRGGFGGGFGIDAASLLANESVQRKLKLSDDQKKDIKAAVQARQEAFEKAKEDKDREGFQKAQEGFTKALQKVVDGLKTPQKTRITQIEVQLATKRNSPSIFKNPDVKKALKLSEKQEKTVKSTLSDLDKDIKEAREENKGDFRKLFTKLGEMNKEAFNTITKTFSDDQKKAWKDLAGEKFEGKGMPFEFGGPRKGLRKDKKKKKDDF